MSKVRVAIAGATGYVGEELIRLLHKHPSVELTSLAASAKREEPVPLAQLLPRFAGSVSLVVEPLDPSRLADSADLIFLALPHGVSMDVVPQLLQKGVRVIDLGADYRLKDAGAFQQWYEKTHTHPQGLSKAVYGITELAHATLSQAALVANPGCYATSIILACAPLLKAGLVKNDLILVDAKSGITGAGRKLSAPLMFAEMNESLWAYKVNHHQHTPEILQALSQVSAGGKAPELCFVPHVVPLNRGILSTIFLRLAKPVSWNEVAEVYKGVYANAPFIRIRQEGVWPKVHEVAGTNFCDLGFTVDAQKGLLIVSSAIDNLLKGAAGQAVQNMNVMYGWPETTGLD